MDKIILELKKSTKNKHVYGTDKTDAPIEAVYIAKSALPSDAPKRIQITVEEE